MLTDDEYNNLLQEKTSCLDAYEDEDSGYCELDYMEDLARLNEALRLRMSPSVPSVPLFG